jgi:hypothetical protein
LLTQQNTNAIYILGDGDQVRSKVEYYLFTYQLEDLTSFSQHLIQAVEEVKTLAIVTMKAQVIMAGGDDILLCVHKEDYLVSHIQKLSEVFFDTSGVTISFGVGNTIETAYLNLRKAKISKTSKIIEEEPSSG